MSSLAYQLKIDPNSTYVFKLNGSASNVLLQYNLFDSNGTQLAFDGTLTEYKINMSVYEDADNINLILKRKTDNVEMSGSAIPCFCLADDTETTVYATDYEAYQKQEITCQVGDTLKVQQYDGYTCITADNIHVTLSGQFVEKIEYLLNERPVILVGLFASRPTDTVDYPRIYVATDKTDTDRTTLLQANQSGATASNWIYI